MPLYRCGGGTPAFPYTKRGTLADFTAANQEQSVDTGLSEIKYFYVEGVPVSYASTMISFAQLDTDRAFVKQIATNNNSSGTSTAVSSGANSEGVITAAGVQIKVSAISGGLVTIKTGNNANYIHKNVKWYAG